MKLKLFILGVSAILILLSSCKKDKETEKEPELNVSATYDGSTFENNPAKDAAKSMRDLINKLGNNRPSKGAVVEITSATLIADYSVGTPNALGIASPYFANNLSNNLFTTYQTNSKATQDGAVINWDSLDATPNGGAGGGYVLSRNQVEIEQLIVKGSFAGVSFNHVANVLFANPKAVTQAQLDAALDLYGSNPTFELSDLTAKYSIDRKKGSGTYHDAIHLEFRKAQAAIKQNLGAEKEKAVKQIILLWEESLAAQTIYYINDVVVYFSKTNTTDDDRAKGCHAWSEVVGIVQGFYQVAGKKITDTQVASILEKLNTTTLGYDGKPIEILGNQTALNKLIDAINDVATIYGLNADDHKRPI
jgi:hypothetical protein